MARARVRHIVLTSRTWTHRLFGCVDTQPGRRSVMPSRTGQRSVNLRHQACRSDALQSMTGGRTHRKPKLSFRSSGAFRLRFAARRFSASLFHDPPRTTRRFVMILPRCYRACHNSAEISIPHPGLLQLHPVRRRIRHRIPDPDQMQNIRYAGSGELLVLLGGKPHFESAKVHVIKPPPVRSGFASRVGYQPDFLCAVIDLNDADADAVDIAGAKRD